LLELVAKLGHEVKIVVGRVRRGAGRVERKPSAARRRKGRAAEISATPVVVNAKDEAPMVLYRHFDLVPLQVHASRLYLPMKTVASLFE